MVVDLDPSAARLTRVAVGVAIGSANRIVHARAGASAALAFVFDRDAHAGSLALVAVGMSVRTADRSPHVGANAVMAALTIVFHGHTRALRFAAVAVGVPIYTANRSPDVRAHAVMATLSFVVDGDTRALGFAAVAVGHAIGATDRSPNIGADARRFRLADAGAAGWKLIAAFAFTGKRGARCIADEARFAVGVGFAPGMGNGFALSVANSGANFAFFAGTQTLVVVAVVACGAVAVVKAEHRIRGALTLVFDLDHRAAGFASVAVRLAVDTADRSVVCGADTFVGRIGFAFVGADNEWQRQKSKERKLCGAHHGVLIEHVPFQLV